MENWSKSYAKFERRRAAPLCAWMRFERRLKQSIDNKWSTFSKRGHDFDTREFHLGALCVIKKGEREPGFDQIFVSPLERKEYGTKELMKRLGLLPNVNDTRSSLWRNISLPTRKTSTIRGEIIEPW